MPLRWDISYHNSSQNFNRWRFKSYIPKISSESFIEQVSAYHTFLKCTSRQIRVTWKEFSWVKLLQEYLLKLSEVNSITHFLFSQLKICIMPVQKTWIALLWHVLMFWSINFSHTPQGHKTYGSWLWMKLQNDSEWLWVKRMLLRVIFYLGLCINCVCNVTLSKNRW